MGQVKEIQNELGKIEQQIEQFLLPQKSKECIDSKDGILYEIYKDKKADKEESILVILFNCFYINNNTLTYIKNIMFCFY